jgi:hypothetical protein
VNLDLVVNHKQGELKAKVTGTAAAPWSACRRRPSSRAWTRQGRKGLRDLLKRFNKK